MAQPPHPASPQPLPAEMVNQHKAGWYAFTRGVVGLSAATAAVLLLMLLVFKIF